MVVLGTGLTEIVHLRRARIVSQIESEKRLTFVFSTLTTEYLQATKGVDSIMPKHKLAVIDGETLMDTRLEPIKYCVDTLIPQGLTILGGAPKIGKSWWVLDLCVRIAKGEPVWGMPTTKGTTLYLCLEDTLRRVQDRLNRITDDVPANAFFATAAHKLADGLCNEIRSFVKEHTDTVFIAIDTFQIVRKVGS